jgi:hypothetical protein
MKTSTTIALALLLGACCTKPQPQTQTQTAPPPPAAAQAEPPAQIDTRPSGGKAIIIPSAPPTFRSKTVLHELINGRPENVISDFTPTMKAALPADKLMAVWKDLETKMGPYQSMGEATQAEEQGYKVVYVPLTFEKGTLRAKVVYDNTNYIAGLFFVP